MTDIQNGKMIDPGKKSWNIKAGVFSSCMLHIIAMTCMLSDHMWATLFPYVDILTCIGRIAFPIFASMIVEGFYRITADSIDRQGEENGQGMAVDPGCDCCDSCGICDRNDHHG